MNRILTIGSIALDTVTTPTGRSGEVLGGSATYFSISASFFRGVDLIATVGEDFPAKYESLIGSFGIGIKGLEKKKGRTFRWEGSYVDDLNCAKTIKTQLNVFSDFKPRIPEGYKNINYLFLANIDPDLQLYVVKKFKNSQVTGCDSMDIWIRNKKTVLKKLLRRVSFVFLNESEARLFSGESNILLAGRYILSLGPKFAIVKRGEHGAALFAKQGLLFMAPAFPLDTVNDPTGAGDAFAGGFIGYLAKIGKTDNSTVRKALLYGSIMASFAVEDFSINRFLRLNKKDIEARHNKFKKLIRP